MPVKKGHKLERWADLSPKQQAEKMLNRATRHISEGLKAPCMFKEDTSCSGKVVEGDDYLQHGGQHSRTCHYKCASKLSKSTSKAVTAVPTKMPVHRKIPATRAAASTVPNQTKDAAYTAGYLACLKRIISDLRDDPDTLNKVLTTTFLDMHAPRPEAAREFAIAT